MRIGLDVRLTYYTRGGIAKYIQRLAERLPALAPHHDHLHAYHRRHRTTYHPAARRLSCWTPAHHRLEPWTLALELAPWRIDLWHAPDFIPPQAGYHQTLITVHDLTFLYHPEFLTTESRRYYNQQIAWAVRRAAAISADSQATRMDLIERLHVPPDKVTVIYLGLDPDYVPQPSAVVAEARQRLKLPSEYILFVGTLEPRKNVPGLLQAYAGLRRQTAETPPLVLAGNTGWLFNETQQLIASLGLERHVHWLENCPAPDLPAVYSGAQVFCLPSHYEGFGLPVLEAMGCGVPCVIANRASLPEISGGAALTVDPDQVEALTAALQQALSNSELRRELRQRGQARAAEFSWDTTARQTLALYETLRP